ncbi:MAG: efflux RND transporter periplasmic adaptor subunit [Pseudomonadota bacterium]
MLGLAVVYASGVLNPPSAPATPVSAVVPEARTLTLTPATHQGTVTAYGQARARFEVTLAAQVGGRITAVAAQADSGFEVGEALTLVEIEEIPYTMAVAEAQRALADAQLRLLQEQRQAERARAEWRSASFDGEPSALALRKPQLHAARAAIESAQATLANARNNLRLTAVHAPFPAVVVERLVGPGDVVQVGTPLLRLASLDRAEIRVPLSEAQWASVQPQAGAAVAVSGPGAGDRWPGYVLRLEQHRAAEDRQRALVVAVDSPLAGDQPLLSGTFVSVALPTRALADAYRVPATALSADGLLWRADERGQLAAFRPATLIHLDDELLAVAPTPLGEIALLVRPLAHLTVGSPVRSVPAEATLFGGLPP